MLASGRCANLKSGTAGNDTLEGTESGDTPSALETTRSAARDDDCLDGDATDAVNGGGAPTLRGAAVATA